MLPEQKRAWFIIGAPSAFYLAIFSINTLESQPLSVVFWGAFILCLAMGARHIPLDWRELTGSSSEE